MDRADLHRLVDELPRPLLSAAARVLEALRDAGDPLARTLAEAPLDDEPVTSGDLDALEEAREAVSRGDVISHDELLREMANWDSEDS